MLYSLSPSATKAKELKTFQDESAKALDFCVTTPGIYSATPGKVVMSFGVYVITLGIYVITLGEVVKAFGVLD